MLKVRFGIERDYMSNRVKIYAGMEENGRIIGHADPPIVHIDNNLEEGTAYGVHKPLFEIDEDETQRLLQMLWDRGFRPNSLHSESDTRKHLQDMRTLVGKAYKVELRD